MASALATSASGPDHQARAVVLADAVTGDIIYARNEQEQLHPASITKIMTALLVVEALDRGDVNINDVLTTSETALAGLTETGMAIGLEVGEEMTLEPLLHAAMLISANDAANVLAEHVGGSIENFLLMMNTRARELGAENTHFLNTHGLTEEGHFSTAYDLFRISQHAISLPRFAELYSLQTRAFRATNQRPAGRFTSTNHMANPDRDEYYPGVFGVKTGFTNAAGWCLVSTAIQDDISLLAVVMGVPTDVEEVNHFSETAAIYDWAFETLEYIELLPATAEIARLSVELGDGVESVGLRPTDSVNALLPRGTTLQNVRQEITEFYDEDNPLTAPVSRGDVLGEITLHYGGRVFGPISLVAAEAVHLSHGAFWQNEVGTTLDNVWVRVVIIVLALLFILYIVYAILYAIKKRKRKKERLKR